MNRSTPIFNSFFDSFIGLGITLESSEIELGFANSRGELLQTYCSFDSSSSSSGYSSFCKTTPNVCWAMRLPFLDMELGPFESLCCENVSTSYLDRDISNNCWLISTFTASRCRCTTATTHGRFLNYKMFNRNIIDYGSLKVIPKL